MYKFDFLPLCDLWTAVKMLIFFSSHLWLELFPTKRLPANVRTTQTIKSTQVTALLFYCSFYRALETKTVSVKHLSLSKASIQTSYKKPLVLFLPFTFKHDTNTKNTMWCTTVWVAGYYKISLWLKASGLLCSSVFCSTLFNNWNFTNLLHAIAPLNQLAASSIMFSLLGCWCSVWHSGVQSHRYKTCQLSQCTLCIYCNYC